MNRWLLRAIGLGMLVLIGAALGAWATTNHFRPVLDAAQVQVAECAAARDNLAGLAHEQGKAMGELTLAANARQAASEKALNEAKVIAQSDYDAANRLQQERIGGNQCAAAVSIIDTELGL